MTNRHNKNLSWARENGYEFIAEGEGVITEGASCLDIFRKGEGFRDHVVGIHRNRPFEILDIEYEAWRGGAFEATEASIKHAGCSAASSAASSASLVVTCPDESRRLSS